ncbi:MAG: AAA family ATPase [bacterium]
MSPPGRPHRLGAFDLLTPAARGASAVTWRAVHRTRRGPVAIKIIDPRPRTPRPHAAPLRPRDPLRRPPRPPRHRPRPRLRRPPPAPRPPPPRRRPYLVMEWIGGGTLAPCAGQLAWPTLRATLLALLDALAHAHARGVIHQDLKAANVLRSERGPVLSDFGVAFSTEHALTPESGPHFMGTPDYMAPEQILMQRRDIGPSTDLYALGCLAFELVTGAPPFTARSRFEVLTAHLDAPAPPVPLRDDMPRGLAAWITRLLDKDPTHRYRFAADAAAALAALPGAPPATMPPAPDRRAALPLPGTGKALFALRETDVFGRDAEQAALWTHLEAMLTARAARLVVLDGPTGVGKSRLSLWLARRAHARGLADGLRATHGPDLTDTGGDGAPAMLARHLRADGLDGDALLDHLITRLGDEDTALGLAAALAPDRRAARGDRAVLLGAARELDEALCRALARLTEERPRVLLLDDAQWGDATLRLVEHLLHHHPRLPVLIIATVCPDRTPPAARARLDRLLAHPAAARLPLGPLDPDQLTAALRARIPLEAGLLQRLVRRAAGSPVFAEELIRHWLRTDALIERAGGLALRARAGDALPDDLLAVWRARLDAALAPLGPAARHARQAAAVLGGTIDRRTWRHITPALGPEILTVAREHLLDARLAHGDADGAWRFAHPMLREALLADARAAGRAPALHRACADALMTRGDDPAHIADHRLAAGDAAEAVPLLFDAARRHRRRREHPAMRRDLLRLAGALRALRRPPDAPERIELRILWAEACQGEDDLRRAWRHVSHAAEQATHRADDRLIGWARVTQAHLRMRDRDAIDRWLIPACAAAERAHDPELAWSAAYTLTFCLVQAGRFDEAEAALGPLARLLAGQADDVMRGDLLRLMALIARGRGRLDEAEASAAQAIALYTRSGSRLKQSHGQNLAGDLARYRGRLDDAARAYRAALHQSELAGSYDALTDELNLGLVLLEMGRHADARRTLTAIAQRAERVGFRVGLVYTHLALMVCEARDRRWHAWEQRWQRIAPIRDGQLVDVDVCRCCEMAAALATDAGRPDRAAAALRLAADQYHRLGRPQDAATARARADALHPIR